MSLENFTVFKKADFTFSPGLNTIIGGAGTGKSHLLKLAYSILSLEDCMIKTDQKRHASLYIADTIKNVFGWQDLDDFISYTMRDKVCSIQANYYSDVIKFHFTNHDLSAVKIEVYPKTCVGRSHPVLIPNMQASLGDVYNSIHQLKYAPLTKRKGLNEIQTNQIIEPIEKAIGGTIILGEDLNLYIRSKTDVQRVTRLSMLSIGLQVMAHISCLIKYYDKFLDRKVLLWDQPETNLSPSLIRLIAKTILCLCQSGVQVFITTHSLFLLRELDILCRSIPFNQVQNRFFELEQTNEGTLVNQGDTIDDVPLTLVDEDLEQSDRFMSEI